MSKKKKLRFPKVERRYCNKDGSEIVDSKPTEIHAKVNPVTLRDKMRSLWSEFRLKEQESGEFESIADAQDFDVERDVEPRSQYECEGDLLDHVDEVQLEQQPEQGDGDVEKDSSEDSGQAPNKG